MFETAQTTSSFQRAKRAGDRWLVPACRSFTYRKQLQHVRLNSARPAVTSDQFEIEHFHAERVARAVLQEAYRTLRLSLQAAGVIYLVPLKLRYGSLAMRSYDAARFAARRKRESQAPSGAQTCICFLPDLRMHTTL